MVAQGDESAVVASVAGIARLPKNLVEGTAVQKGQNVAALSSKDSQKSWERILVEYLHVYKEINTKQAAELWNISERGARTRIKKMVEHKIVIRIATSPNDPKTVYVLAKSEIE